jgi:hypothetical protein
MTERFRRSVHRHENNVRFLDSGRNIRTEKQIAATSALYDIVQARFKNREAIAIPSVNASLININHCYFYIGALIGDNSHSGAADIARANAKNPSIVIHNDVKLEKNVKKE